MVVLGTVALVFALLVSFYLALAWGEVAGIPAGGDKTALGGLFVVPLFMGMRWVALAVALATATATGAFQPLAAGRGTQYALVLGAHLGLGLASVAAFNWIADGLTHDVMGPQRWSWLFGVWLPLPAFAAAGWGLHAGALGRRPILAWSLAGALLLLHLLPFQNRRADMQRTAERLREIRAREAAAPDGPTE